MADRLYVVNQALGHLGEPTADTLDPSALREGTRKLLVHIDAARDAVLQRHGWLDALEYLTAERSEGVPGNWKYAYHFLLPPDALRVWTVDGCAKWESGTLTDENQASRRLIRADSEGPLYVAYVRRAAWEALRMSILDAIGLEAAARACKSVTGDEGEARRLKGLAEQAVALAMGQEGGEEGGQDEEIYDHMAALRRSAG